MWELDHKEDWELKNRCFWTVLLEKTLESPLDCKEIKQVNPQGDQSWIFISRTDAEAESPNTLATWYKGPIHQKRSWCWERLKGKGDGGSIWWHSLMKITDSMDMNLNKPWQIVQDRGVWHAAAQGVGKSWTQLWDSSTKTTLKRQKL